MKRFIVAAALAVFSFPAYAQSPRDVAERLQLSVVELTQNGSPSCTATKIGPTEFLTAKHCVAGLPGNLRLEASSKLFWPKSVLVALEDKEDWAILTAFEETPDIKPMDLACSEKLYLGMPVAMLGYSFPTDPSFSVGTVSSLKRTRIDAANADFAVDIQAGPGASGAAIVSMESGRIIGVLIEGVMRSRNLGAFLVGVQSITGVDRCEGLPELAAAESHASVVSF